MKSQYTALQGRKALLDACINTKSGSKEVVVSGTVVHEVLLLLEDLDPALSPATALAPTTGEAAGPQWSLVLDDLPEDGAEPLYVLGRWGDGDIRRCQVYKGQLSCGFPARGGNPIWWMPEPVNPPALQQDGECTACQYPRYILKDQYWGSCSNEECPAFKEDMASASYINSTAPVAPANTQADA